MGEQHIVSVMYVIAGAWFIYDVFKNLGKADAWSKWYGLLGGIIFLVSSLAK